MKKFIPLLLLLLIGAGVPQRTPTGPPGQGQWPNPPSSVAGGVSVVAARPQTFFFDFPNMPEVRPFEVAQFPGQLSEVRLTISADFMHQLVAVISGAFGSVQGSGHISMGVFAASPSNQELISTTAAFTPAVVGPTGEYTVLTFISTVTPGVITDPAVLAQFEGTGMVTLQALIGSSLWSWQCNGSCSITSSAQGSMTFTLEYLTG